MDKDRSHTLSYDELRNGLHRYGLYLDDDTVQKLSRDLDKERKIDFEEFLSAIKGPMNARRLARVEKAFCKMDVTGDSVITIEDIRQLFDVSQHPKYQKGEWTAAQCYRQILNIFDSPNDKDGMVGYFLEK